MKSVVDFLKAYKAYDMSYDAFVNVIKMNTNKNKGVKKLFIKNTNNDIIQRCKTLLDALYHNWRYLYTSDDEWNKVRLTGRPISDKVEHYGCYLIESIFIDTIYVVESIADECNGKGHKPDVVVRADRLVNTKDIIEQRILQVAKNHGL